jgi:hypothetical protein
MIDMEETTVQPQQTIIATSGIYGFQSGDYWVRSVTSNGLDNSTFDFGPGTQTTTPGYSAYTNPESSGGWGSRVVNCSGGRNPGSPIACPTSTNSRASFNGGTMVVSNRIPVSMAVSSLANGSTATFYAYSPFVQGNARLAIGPDSQSGSMLGLIVDQLSDNSGSYANEIKIVLRNVSGSTVTATVPMLLTIGIP